MVRLTTAQRALLRGFENTSYKIAETINHTPLLKRATHAYLHTVGSAWVHYSTRHLLRVWGMEHVQNLDPDRGILLVSNHRSFFDMYVLSCVLLRRTSFIREMYFPVRGEFFYTRPLGVVVNSVMSAMAMYPPVLRESERRSFNPFVVDFITDALRRPGAMTGYHPEGTRNKTADPYTLLPASPGVGQIAHRARPIVVPAFILGLGNNFPKQIKSNFDGTGAPVTIQFGAPVDLESFYAQPGTPENYRAISEHLRTVLMGLAAQERAARVRDGLPTLAREAAPATAAEQALREPTISLAPDALVPDANESSRAGRA